MLWKDVYFGEVDQEVMLECCVIGQVEEEEVEMKKKLGFRIRIERIRKRKVWEKEKQGENEMVFKFFWKMLKFGWREMQIF